VLGNGQRVVLWEVGLALLWLVDNAALLDDAVSDEDLKKALEIQLGKHGETGRGLDEISDSFSGIIGEQLKDEVCRKGGEGREPAEWRTKDLYHGLASYHLARRLALLAEFEPRADTLPQVAEMVLRGNILIGGYEQRRVQMALNYPLSDFAEEFFLDRARLNSVPRGKGGLVRRRAYAQSQRAFSQHVNPLWERFFTDQLLTIQVGDELLRLGRDLPLPPGGWSMYPPDLAQPLDSWLNTLLRRYDHSFGEGHGTQARMWSNFDDRMNFIVNFMRSRAQVAGLWRSPFEEAGIRDIRAGRTPGGVL
jgi:hypothetical protein